MPTSPFTSHFTGFWTITLARQRDVDRLVAAGADAASSVILVPGLAAHLLDRLVERIAVDQLAVDMGDVVARLDARARRPGVSSCGAITLTAPSSIVTVRPSPP